MNYSMPVEVWNNIAQYYPGPDYVDWLGLSVYGQQYVEDHWSPFEPLFDWPYTEITKLEPNKPVMLAEWGIGEFPQFGSKSGFITEAFEIMKKYPKVKAAVFWNERWQNEPIEASQSDGRRLPRWRATATCGSIPHPEALAAYRKGVARPVLAGQSDHHEVRAGLKQACFHS